jgi:hypothetical protein
VVDGDKVVAHLGLGALGARDERLEVAAQDLATVAADLRLALDEGVDALEQQGRIASRRGHAPAREAVGLLQQRLEQVLRLDDLVRGRLGDVGRGDDGLPGLLRELVLGDALATSRARLGARCQGAAGGREGEDAVIIHYYFLYIFFFGGGVVRSKKKGKVRAAPEARRRGDDAN